MKYTITNITPQIDQATGVQKDDPTYGKSYSVWVKDDAGQTYSFFKSWKKEAPKIGETVEGTLTQKTSQAGNLYYSFKPENTFKGNSYNSPENEKAKWATMCLAYAKDIAVANIAMGKDFTPAKLFDLAEKMLNWAKDHADDTKPADKAPEQPRGIKELVQDEFQATDEYAPGQEEQE